MKKTIRTLIIFFLIGILTGCDTKDNQKEKIASKTCTIIQEDKLEQAYTYTADNDKLQKVKLIMTYDNQTINLPENAIETLNDDQKENLKADTLASLGLEKNNYEGLEITIDINDKMIITIDADLDESNPEILTKLGLNYQDIDMSFNQIIKNMQESGAICN